MFLLDLFESPEKVREWVNAEFRSVDCVQKRPYSYVRGVVPLNGVRFYGYGFSKVMYPDEWDEVEGFKIALTKAKDDVAEQIVRVWHAQRDNEEVTLFWELENESCKEDVVESHIG